MKRAIVTFIIIIFMIMIGVNYSYAKKRVGNSFSYNDNVCENYDELNMVQKIDCLDEKIKVLNKEVEKTYYYNYKKCNTPTEQQKFKKLFRKECENIDDKLDFIKERYKDSGSYGTLIYMSHQIELFKKLINNLNDITVGPGDTSIDNNDY